jgi:hypothetical protein
MIETLVLLSIAVCSSACGILFFIGFIGASSPFPDSNSEKDKRI